MMDNKHIHMQKKIAHQEKILLMTMPFLTPLIPPMGISCLKSYLRENGYTNVKTVDAMAEIELRQLCYLYFDTLERYIPETKRGFYFNVGLDVLYNHMMAHLNYTVKHKYIDLVKLLVYRNFYVNIDTSQVEELDKIVADFYVTLEKYMIRQIGQEKPTILGFSVFKGTLGPSLYAAKVVKNKWPEVKIVMGGSIFSQDLFPGTPNFFSFLERTPYIDHIFIGEGEKLFWQYLRGQLPAGKRVYTLNDINGELLDLNSLEIPDFSDLDLAAYPLLSEFTSRGCVHKCSFCAETLFWKKYHRKNVKKIADELEQLSEKYGRNVFVFSDCLINPLVTELSNQLLSRNLKIYWDVTLKVDKPTCYLENTMLWRQGGFYRARLGVESGSQKLLNIINKKITLQQIKASLISLATAGIKTTVYLIAGHPGETEEDFQQTLDLVEEFQDYIYEVEVDPFRFFYNGQVNSGVWGNKRLLYPEDDTNMLLTQTWVLNEEPARPVIYERGWRLKSHCKKLGVPNPYSVSEIYEADQRWKRLHKNAVPSLWELSKDITNIHQQIQVLQTPLLNANDIQLADDADFNF